jgi:hypothetical protein
MEFISHTAAKGNCKSFSVFLKDIIMIFPY